MSSKLADIISKRRKSGEGVFSSLGSGIKDKLREKFDPRQMINQKGILTALFPGLKAYKALPEVDKKTKELSSDVLEQVSLVKLSPVLEDISINTKLAAKNSLTLPTMMRDVNLIRQNIVKLVKSEAETPATKADAFFQKSKEREQLYENLLKRERQSSKTGKELTKEEEKSGGLLSTIMGILSFKKLFDSIKSLGETFKSSFKWLSGKMVGIFFSLGRYILMAVLPFIVKMFKKAIRGAFKIFTSSFTRTLLTELGLLLPRLIATLIGVALGSSFLQSTYGKKMSADIAGSNLGNKALTKGDTQYGPAISQDVPAQAGTPTRLTEELLKGYTSKYVEALRNGSMQSYVVPFPSNDASPHNENIPLTKQEAAELGTRYKIIKSLFDNLQNETDVQKKMEMEKHLRNLIHGVQVFMRNRLADSRENAKPILEYADRAIEEFKLPGSIWEELSNLPDKMVGTITNPVTEYVNTEMNEDSLKGIIGGLNESAAGLEPERTNENALPGPEVDNRSRDNNQLRRDISNQEPNVQVMPSVNTSDSNNVKAQTQVGDVYDTDFLRNHWMDRTTKEIGAR